MKQEKNVAATEDQARTQLQIKALKSAEKRLLKAFSEALALGADIGAARVELDCAAAKIRAKVAKLTTDAPLTGMDEE